MFKNVDFRRVTASRRCVFYAGGRDRVVDMMYKLLLHKYLDHIFVVIYCSSYLRLSLHDIKYLRNEGEVKLCTYFIRA